MARSDTGSCTIFFMGSMVEHGIAKAYLDAHCDTEQFKLCAWKNKFPTHSYAFVRNEKAAIGAYKKWQEASEEFGTIIEGSLQEKTFLKMHALASLDATIQQLGMNAIGDGWGSFTEWSSVQDIITKYMFFDLPLMRVSRQQQNKSYPLLTFQKIISIV